MEQPTDFDAAWPLPGRKAVRLMPPIDRGPIVLTAEIIRVRICDIDYVALVIVIRLVITQGVMGADLEVPLAVLNPETVACEVGPGARIADHYPAQVRIRPLGARAQAEEGPEAQ